MSRPTTRFVCHQRVQFRDVDEPDEARRGIGTVESVLDGPGHAAGAIYRVAHRHHDDGHYVAEGRWYAEAALEPVVGPPREA